MPENRIFRYTLPKLGKADKLSVRFPARFQTAHTNAVGTISRAWERMDNPYEYPEPHCKHLRANNAVEGRLPWHACAHTSADGPPAGCLSLTLPYATLFSSTTLEYNSSKDMCDFSEWTQP